MLLDRGIHLSDAMPKVWSRQRVLIACLESLGHKARNGRAVKRRRPQNNGGDARGMEFRYSIIEFIEESIRTGPTRCGIDAPPRRQDHELRPLLQYPGKRDL